MVDGGPVGRLQVVCGAKNFAVGDKVPLATIGTHMPGGTEIKQASLRGVESFGMLCSAKDLALPENAPGLVILDPSTKLGIPFAEAVGLDDVVLTLDLTPNRPDALNHLGIARELAALTKQELKKPRVVFDEEESEARDKIRVRVENERDDWDETVRAYAVTFEVLVYYEEAIGPTT